MISPAEIEELVPYVDSSILLGGFYEPTVGIVDSLGACAALRERAEAARRARGLPRDGGDGHRRRAWARARCADDERRRPRRGRRHRVWRVEPAARADGGRGDPADSRGAPDDRRRSRAVVRRPEGRDRVPDRARHGRGDVRAPALRAARDRLLRAPPDPPRPRGAAARRRGRPLADGAAVHGGRFRAAARGRARADAVPPRRVGAGREGGQRDPLPDARRGADHRRDAGGARAVGGGGRVDQGRPRRRARGRRVACRGRERDRPPRLRRRALPRAPEDAGAREGENRRGVQQDVRHRPPRRAVGLEPRRPGPAVRTSDSATSAPSSSRPPAGRGRSGTSRTRS